MTKHQKRRHQKGGFLDELWKKTKNAASGLSNSFTYSGTTSSYTPAPVASTPAPAPVASTPATAPVPTSSINSWGGRRHRKKSMKGRRRKLRNTRRRH